MYGIIVVTETMRWRQRNGDRYCLGAERGTWSKNIDIYAFYYLL